MKQEVQKIAKSLKSEFIKLSEYIGMHPELGYEEFLACSAHIKLLQNHHFIVEKEYLGMKTAFKAVFDSHKPGPVIAFLSEYDALPGIGHGCGHNLLGATNTGAGIVLSKFIKNLKGKVIVYGTPAEETNGAKATMAKKCAFDGVDIVMEAHPDSKHHVSGSSLALEALQFTFKGQAAHAAAFPEKGINALDAAIHTFTNINALRQYILPDARIHGVIIEGGKAANIIPDLAIAQFYVRATTKKYLQELSEKVKNCARGASLATGAQLEITHYESSFDNFITNETLSAIYRKRLTDVGVNKIYGPKDSWVSLDAGNVSHIVPAIHPWFGICEEDISIHTKEFATATQTPLAYQSMIQTIEALVLTAMDILIHEELLFNIKKEFQNTCK
jgi:amidohydrolase